MAHWDFSDGPVLRTLWVPSLFKELRSHKPRMTQPEKREIDPALEMMRRV